MSKSSESFSCMFPVVMPWKVALSMLMGVGGYGCNISVKVVLIRTDTWLLWNVVPVSALEQ